MRTRLIPLVAVLALAGCTADSATPGVSPSPAPAVAAATVASLTDPGAWEEMVERCGSGELVVVQAVTMADVTADGTPDAVVARACEGDTEYGPSRVEVFDGTSAADRPQRLGTLLGDAGADKPYVDTVEYLNGAVLIRANGVDESSDAACPEVVYTYRYTYAAGTFTRTERTQKPDETCGPS